MLTRRQLLERSALAGAAGLLPLAGCAAPAGRGDRGDVGAGRGDEPVWVNDVHSQLNRTRVRAVVRPTRVEELQAAVEGAAREGLAVSVCGGRHAMGGQQFGTDTLLVDTRGLTGLVDHDPEAGQVEVGAGMEWPALMDLVIGGNVGLAEPWGVVQKQTGADRMTLGGSLAANIHGRGLDLAPLVQDVEAFELVDPSGRLLRCSRQENEELFRLAVGGYGMFGVMSRVRLRLGRWRRLERIVEVTDADGLADRFEQRRAEGCLYGDFQFATDVDGPHLLSRGVFSAYRPVPLDTPGADAPLRLGREDWLELLALAHTDPAAAFDRYAAHYLRTSGQLYWSDTHQLSTYVDDYHAVLGPRLAGAAGGSEMITEISVPRASLEGFLADVRDDFREHRPGLVYGTVRLVEQDTETALAWARQPWACVIFNLHTEHDDASLERTAGHFRRLIDHGLRYGGTYYLT